MDRDVVALFPLSHVLLPGMPLPLHLFEQRYRDLLADIAGGPGQPRFGVVALRSGTEALNPRLTAPDTPDVESIGTLAEVLEVQTAEDGTSDLLAVGSRRFEIEALVTDRAYLRAEVRFLDEDDGPLDAADVARARALLERYDAMLLGLAGRVTGADLPRDPSQLSYQIGARLPLPPGERQALLAEPTTGGRVRLLLRLLRREIVLLDRTRSIAVSPTVVRIDSGSN